MRGIAGTRFPFTGLGNFPIPANLLGGGKRVFPEFHTRILDERVHVVLAGIFLQYDAVELPHTRKPEDKDGENLAVATVRKFFFVEFTVFKCLEEVRDGEVIPIFVQFLGHFLESTGQQRFIVALLVENGRIQLLLPCLAPRELAVEIRKERLQFSCFPVVENAIYIAIRVFCETARAARLVFQEEGCHLQGKIEQVVFVKSSLRVVRVREVAGHFVVDALVVRDPVRFARQVGENHVHQDIRRELAEASCFVFFSLDYTFPHQDIKQEPVDGALVQVGEHALLLHPAQAKPLLEFRVREYHDRGVERVGPGGSEGFDHLVGEMLQIQCKFKM